MTEQATKPVIVYECDDCGKEFKSKRARSGPKLCGPDVNDCIGKRRKLGTGPLQSKGPRPERPASNGGGRKRQPAPPAEDISALAESLQKTYGSDIVEDGAAVSTAEEGIDSAAEAEMAAVEEELGEDDEEDLGESV